ncbi:MAG: hypothetical protein AABY06_00055 [Nanoarchaeota archaeon]
MSFSKYVRREVLKRIECGPIFKTSIDEIKEKNFHVSTAKYPVYPELNIVLIETIENPKEIYFRSFSGCKMMGEHKTKQEHALYLEKIKEAVSPKFKVKRKDLEKKIINLLNKASS